MNNHSVKEDCKEIPVWIKTINDNPDMLHSDYTPSVQKLSECGINAAIAVLPLLNSESQEERLRAQRVLEGVVQRRYGWQVGQGYPAGSDGEQKFRSLWQEMGSYQADASKEQRAVTVKKWEQWLQNQMEDDK